jgi:putative endonuclease
VKSERAYYVYIMSNNAGITYIGVTNDLFRRVNEHKTGALPGFTRKHKTHKLVYYEEFQYIEDAIFREKQIKAYSKEKKRNLIKSINPKWMDLSVDWYVDEDSLPF